MNASKSNPALDVQYRILENGHIFFWLIKDTCWALEFKPGGIIMIIPTVAMAFYLLWRTRKQRTEFMHNMAVCFWISANSAWMIGEFNDYDARPVAATLFILGLTVLIVYYLFYFKKDRQRLLGEATEHLPTSGQQ